MKQSIIVLGIVFFSMVTSALLGGVVQAEDAIFMELKENWILHVEFGKATAVLTVAPPDYVTIKAEKYDHIPLFNPNGPQWRKGLPLDGVKADECSATSALQPDSIIVRESATPNSTV